MRCVSDRPVRARLLRWTVAVGTFGAATVPALAQEPDIVSIDNTGPMAVKLIVVIGVLAVLLFASRQLRIGQFLRTAVIWIALFAGLMMGYAYRDRLEVVGRDVVSVLIPGTPVTRGESVTVHRAFRGQFVLEGAVGGTPVTFLFDTGASMVVLTADDARRAGFHADRLDYRVPVMTANGMTQVAPVRLSSLSIGGISVDNVRAAVAKPGDLEASLLGMTFLDRLDGYQVQRDRLVLNP